MVRGSEYLTSTPKYVLLYDALGWEHPIYVHLPLLMGKSEDGSVSKLSKRHGAVSFQDLVNDGYLPEAIVNYIALLGWCPKNSETEFFTLSELREAFTLDGISKSPAVFDYNKLLWFNGEYIKKLPFDEFLSRVRPFRKKDLPENVNEEKMLRLVSTRLDKLSEVDEKTAFFSVLPDYTTDLFINKKNKVTTENAKTILENACAALKGVETFDNDALYNTLLAVAEKLGVKSGAVMWCVRIAVAGLSVTPGGATEIMEVIGKEESLRRLRIAIEKF